MARREVRLDAEHDQRLQKELRRREITRAAWVREQIDRQAEEEARAERMRVAQQLCALGIDWGYRTADEPDPASALVRWALDEAMAGLVPE